MKNIKLFENFQTREIPESKELINEINEFLGQGVDILHRNASLKDDLDELFLGFLDFFQSKNYDFTTYPDSMGVPLDQYKKFSKALKSLYLPKKISSDLRVFSIKCTHLGKEIFLLLFLDKIKGIIYVGYYDQFSVDMVFNNFTAIKFPFDAIFFDHGDFVEVELTWDNFEEEGASFKSVKTSNGKSYTLLIALERDYDGKIIDLRDDEEYFITSP